MILFLELLPVLIAAACILIAFIPERLKIADPVSEEAEIIDRATQKIHRHYSETLVFAPVVRYQTEQGELTAAARDFVPEWQYAYRTGDKIRIYYEKTQPEIFVIQNGSRSAFRKTICLTAGIGILTAYAVLCVQYNIIR